MKPFLGIDLTTDKKNERMNGMEFRVQTPSSVLSNTLKGLSEQAENTVKQAELPLFLRVLQFICGFSAALIACGILKSDVSFAEGYRNVPWLHWVAGICAVVWLILWCSSKQKKKTVLHAEESKQTLSHLEGTVGAILKEFAVPDDAKEVDVLFFFYKIKNGEIKVQEKAMQIAPYFNPIFKIFADDENLYLANLDGKHQFPRSSIVKIHTVKKRIRIAGWNKEEKYNKGIYKQYKLTTDNYGSIHCKYYHILEVNHRGETFGIYFPCYELPIFEEYVK